MLEWWLWPLLIGSHLNLAVLEQRYGDLRGRHDELETRALRAEEKTVSLERHISQLKLGSLFSLYIICMTVFGYLCFLWLSVFSLYRMHDSLLLSLLSLAQLCVRLNGVRPS